MLMMMIGDELWFIDDIGTASKELKQEIFKKFSDKSLPVLSNLGAALEVRIQPRGLSGPGKPVSIDVMASFRLAGKPSNGLTVI
jgi:hypothetical protein